jgi:hypothetical protein
MTSSNHCSAENSDLVLARVADLLETRLPARGGDPATSYVAKLFSKGPDAFLGKNESCTKASWAERPRIALATSRTFLGLSLK